MCGRSVRGSIYIVGTMRDVAKITAATAALLVCFAAASVAETEAARPAVEACASEPGKLGLSRIVEIDTSGGPWLGGSHAGRTDFLRDGEVVLTFDDGPLRPYTRPVLKALAAHCTKATFFMVGRMAVADPVMAREVAAAGHTIGSHTWAHQNLKPIGVLRGTREFEMGISTVSKAIGQPVAPFFRFPFLSESRAVAEHARERNVAIFSIDVDSKDFLTRDSNAVFQKIMDQLKAQRKGIILMHDIQPSTAGMIKRLLDELRDKGFKVVHVVPKAAVATLAGYDGEADKLLAAKYGSAKANSLASRSLVWTMAPSAAGAAGAAAASGPPNRATARPSPTPAKAATGDTFPWENKPAKRPSPPAKKPPPAVREELPWQPKFFGY